MKNQNGDKVSTRTLYELVDRTRKELKEDIQNLELKFDTLEAGRLSSLETKFANMEGKILATTGLIAFIISVAITLLGFFIQK